ncbi:hypothetical protein [Phenylobacterium sp.]|uniref:hypothetical protein n=1 Tax=Phenylobacterium sp. TaxID=1871053 RepID=UPI002717A872|nr:hypothetical protein [Phenylobacterium sp.]MDO8799833.1 hypothetical protein [Phenylobacterium sp.]
MKNQLTRGLGRRLMYIENKDGDIDGVPARIGWAEFSKTGKTVRYRGRELASIGGRGVRGNFIDAETREEYWVSDVSNAARTPTRPRMSEWRSIQTRSTRIAP